MSGPGRKGEKPKNYEMCIVPNQWKPGENGNKKPGPKKGHRRFDFILRDILAQEIEIFDPIEKKTCKAEIGRMVALALVARGIKGDVSAFQEIADRVDGKVSDAPEDEESKDSLRKSIFNIFVKVSTEKSAGARVVE